jgi:RecB family endonuclease NucS
MPIYEVTPKEFRRIEEKGFSISGLKERSDIQRLLRTQIDVIGEDLYVLTEEFSEWDESKRRIDLLAIDANANLVVIEIKRTTDGGHMELQAIRYAAMGKEKWGRVSTFDI